MSSSTLQEGDSIRSKAELLARLRKLAADNAQRGMASAESFLQTEGRHYRIEALQQLARAAAYEYAISIIESAAF